MAESKSGGLLKPYQLVTERIVATLEQGVVPWRQPWANVGAPRNLASGNEYRGINTFTLAATGAMMGFASPWWLTFRQAKEHGGSVRKGERGSVVVFWKMLDRKESDDADGDEDAESRQIPFLRHSTVFNVQQCDGIDCPQSQIPAVDFDPIIQCECIVAGMPRPPTIRHGDSRAYYAPLADLLNMPHPGLFDSPPLYYAVLFHELTHATGHPSRLDREAIRNPAKFGSAAYAKEELVAEMGTAFLCGRAGIEQATLENSAAYVQGWIARLRGDPKLAVQAASAAQKAADWILGREAPRENTATVTEAVGRLGTAR